MDMIERVAQRLFQNMAASDNSAWETADPMITRACMSYARAAIAAMREPTEEMYQGVCALNKRWQDSNSAEIWQAMMDAVLLALGKTLPAFVVTDMAVNCHHNYVSRENHFGANVLVTRKGAVRARAGDLGIIPGSMGTGSFIVRGKGNPESFCSCSHGAGRAMSRGKAKASITMEQHAIAMQGIEARLDADVIDESPAAYKDIGAVMAAQDSLVEIVHRLRQVLNVKG
ncbi:tRNA-splicing ligase, RtcB [uncultured Caudovirales phage]|uniref:3'-phosphate/5'-hydroxy nucleic acid ligase n=1 Tax=uncultured Caudovirales phage TaxID=2100421 RepID=A0A6J5R670_9CAUD|nr:tRNA-splicing ligase, RtcB [uncultured Caudovirales phage]